MCKLILGDPGSVGQGGVSVLGEVYGETVSISPSSFIVGFSSFV